MNKQLILIDGSSYLFRAFHALPPLTTSKGVPTGAIYGVINMIKKLMNTTSFDYIGVIFDPKGKTVRHAIYPEYKANRKTMPDELREQIAPLFELIRAMGLPLIIQDGVEADDVIGTLAVYASKHGIKTVISTMDKDMAQLVNDKITLINTMNDRVYDDKGVKEKFGVAPNQIIDYLALMGDTSDNIPGIPKVGPKTAALWLEKYGSLNGVIKHASEITGKIGESLREHINNLSLSRQLVTIDCDVKLNLELENLKKGEANVEALKTILTELQFTKWLRELQEKTSSVAGATDTLLQSGLSHYHAIQDEKSFEAFFQRLVNAKEFSMDTETTSLDAMRAELVGMSFSVKAGKAVYIPFIHKNPPGPTDRPPFTKGVIDEQLDRNKVLKRLTPLLHDKHKTIVGQNLKYDYKVLKNQGVTITAPMQDTLLESYVLNSANARHDLDTLALKYLNKNTIKFEDVAGKGAKQITFDYVPISVATNYAAEDADVALQLHHTLMPQILAEKSYEKVLTQIEWPLMPILANMEFTGVLVNAEKLKKQSGELACRINILQNKAFELVGNEFNLSSPKQLQEILFDKMKLPVLKKTPTGAPSTDEEVMQELALDFELPKVIVEYRQLSKLKSTYADALPAQINPKTGRVHTSYNQAVTSTGRLSSANPNLQNIPIRSEEGRKIRQAFIAPTGCKIVSADYSQIELRIMAHLSKDPGLLSAFEKKQDVHAATAAEVFGIALNDVTSDMRRSAKAINFGLLYGMSAFGLAKQLGVDRNEAQKYMDTYFSRYPNVHRYMDEAREFAKKNGYVETLLGRRLFTPEINASNQMRRKMAERAAINAPLQGTAADIIKLAMICVDEKLPHHAKKAVMIMQVHDELVFEVQTDCVPEICGIIQNCMENALSEPRASAREIARAATTIDVPLEIAIGVGDNWDEAH
ncbi:MAG: DNA polymerase I [Gammaproteobacteria bacterium RIFCSPHIGHO2_12_FULL_38_11]|nr:MAG: DNA polymerase I [Gammaproteobacteria bacterium RIFCSPHIGHO2_12_FULL_38_11]